METKHLQKRWLNMFNNNVNKFFINKTVLDIGCLDGYSTNQFIRFGCKSAIGIDIESKYIKKAKLEYPEINFKVQDAEEIDFNYLDNIDVVSCLGLTYLLHDPIKFLNNLSTQNKSNTIIIETVYNNSENYPENSPRILNADVIKNFFINKNWKLSYEKIFTINQINNQINKDINFANRIILVFERML